MKTYLKEWMEHANVDSSLLAQETKVSEKMILKYMEGKPTPSLQDALLFADVLDISIDDLVKYDPNDVCSAEDELQVTITTSSFSEVVRFRNYCNKYNIKINIVVFIDKYEDSPIYIMNVNDVFTLEDITKICKSRKYADKKLEKMTSDDRYEGMIVVRYDKSSKE